MPRRLPRAPCPAAAGGPVAPRPRQRSLWLVLVVLADPTGVRWNLTAGLTCVSPMSGDAERLSVCLSAIRASPRKCRFRCSAWFLIAVFVLLSGAISAPRVGGVVRRHLLPSGGRLSAVSRLSLPVQKLFSLMKILFVFAFTSLAFEVRFLKSFVRPRPVRCCLRLPLCVSLFPVSH